MNRIESFARLAEQLCRMEVREADALGLEGTIVEELRHARVEPPAPFARVTLGASYVEVELGDVEVTVEALDARFGPASPVMPAPGATMDARRYRVEVPGAGHACTIYAAYRGSRVVTITWRRDLTEVPRSDRPR